MTILWLDDKEKSISYEVQLIKEKNKNVKVIKFVFINELLQYLEMHTSLKNVLFIIDVMLIGEKKIEFNNISVNIPNELMAGTVLYTQLLNIKFKKFPVILYTSRGTDNSTFKKLLNDPRINKSLFIIGKEQLETQFRIILKTLGINI